MTALAQSESRSRSQPSVADDPAGRIAALFDAHCGFVCRVLRHHGVHEAALDDAVQDVFVTAHRRWSSFAGRSSAQSWLYGIARRIAFRYRRAADTRARYFVDASPDAPEAVDEPFARAHAAHSLAALLHGLDADKRTVFVLTEVEGMTAPEVAEALGIPLGTAYSRLRAAWQVLGRRAAREQQRLRRELPAMRSEPTPERRRQLWGLVAGGLPRAPAGTSPVVTATWLTQAKWIAVGAALGVGLLGARAAMVASRRTDGPAPARTELAPVERSPAAAPPVIEAATRKDAVPRLAPAPANAPPEPASPPRATASLPPRTPAAAAVAAPAAGPADALTAELALLQRARVALREGRAADALTLLEQHARAFPRGQLGDERRTLQAQAEGSSISQTQ